MQFSKQDRRDYKSYLLAEIEKEQAKPDSFMREYNLTMLNRDLWNIDKTI